MPVFWFPSMNSVGTTFFLLPSCIRFVYLQVASTGCWPNVSSGVQCPFYQWVYNSETALVYLVSIHSK